MADKKEKKLQKEIKDYNKKMWEKAQAEKENKTDKKENKTKKKKKESFWQLGKSGTRITVGDLLRSVAGTGGLNKGGLIKGKPKLAKRGWK